MILQLTSKAIGIAKERKFNKQICRIFVLTFLSAAFCLINVSAAFSQADFAVIKTASSSSVGAGGNITYTITVTNNGPGVATFNQTILSDGIPENTTFVSLMYNAVDWNCVTPTAGGTGSINCFNQITIASGTSYQFTLVVRVNSGTAAGTVIQNTALVGHTFDPNTFNNQSTTMTTVVAPTAALVAISGRVMTQKRRGIKNVQVRLVNEQGESRTVITSAFGYYGFADVPAGQTYVIIVSATKYAFAEPVRVLSVFDETEGINFIAENKQKCLELNCL